MATAIGDDAAQMEMADALRVLRAPGGLVVRAADAMGRVVGFSGMRLLATLGIRPDPAALTQIAEVALTRAYDVTVLGLSLPGPSPQAAGPMVAVSGFAWGMAGFIGFLPDATFTTLMIMREIVRVAQEEGEDLSSEEGRAACLAVFSLRAGEENGYFGARLMLEGTAARGLLTRLAVRWGAVLGEKFAAQAVPIAGALAGAALNTAFLEHYRKLARAHFTVRRLRRHHGDAVRDAPLVVDAQFVED